MRIKTLEWLLVLMLLSSCDPWACVVINNSSQHDKRVTVVRPPGYVMRNDSLIIYGNQSGTTVIRKDTVTKTNSFILKPGCNAQVESHMGVPGYQIVYIIDDKDTISVYGRKKSGFRKRPKLLLGCTWTYDIKN